MIIGNFVGTTRMAQRPWGNTQNACFPHPGFVKQQIGGKKAARGNPDRPSTEDGRKSSSKGLTNSQPSCLANSWVVTLQRRRRRPLSSDDRPGGRPTTHRWTAGPPGSLNIIRKQPISFGAPACAPFPVDTANGTGFSATHRQRKPRTGSAPRDTQQKASAISGWGCGTPRKLGVREGPLRASPISGNGIDALPCFLAGSGNIVRNNTTSALPLRANGRFLTKQRPNGG